MSLVEARSKHGDASDGVAAGTALGARISRLDGPAKIRGAATYALEHRLANLAYAVAVQSTVAAGRIRSIDTKAAEAAPGVLLVLTAANALPLTAATDWLGTRPSAAPYLPFAREVAYVGQQVAAVVAETLEQAIAAAALVKIEYEEQPHIAGLDDPRASEGIPIEPMRIEWGDAEAALTEAPVRIEQEYRTPREYHATIEPHGLIAQWEDDQLTVWEPSQWIAFMARTYSEWFGIPFENVRLISPYIGGGFGSKAFCYDFDAIPVMAAKMLGRPVKLVLTRPQLFNAIGGRAATRQSIALGADREGRLLAIRHRGANETSVRGVWVEPLASCISVMYATPNFSSRQNIVPVNTVTPGALRAPGENPSAFGIESAIDELAHELGLDPLEIRLRNYAEQDPHAKKPWSTRQLREAFAAGAAAFGWSKRDPRPRAMRAGRQLVGYGMAAGTFPMRRSPAEALVRILGDGRVQVASSSIDMGTGTYTILAQVAAEVIGVPVDSVEVMLGDSLLPPAPVGGGSQLANVMAGVVHKAALAAREELIGLAINDPASPFRAAQANTLAIAEGRISLPRDEGAGLPIAELMRRLGREKIEVQRDTQPETARTAEDRFNNYATIAGMQSPTEGDYSRHSWCAHFVEVRVDEDFGTVRVARVVSALDCGRLYNPKLVESQWKGAIIMGIGQALLEEGVVDPRNGRLMSNNLADYLIATNADIPDIQVISVGIPDPHASALGGKGVGEVGIVGVAPAVANAVFHATGKRIRALPITLEKLL